ncbi:hypothetical protein LUZ60_013749 [Juncus effusus]|nr:hypothetical protein LUZ60_013749 [Juncus effusus]
MKILSNKNLNSSSNSSPLSSENSHALSETTMEKEPEETDNLYVSIQEKLAALPGEPHKAQPTTIFRVPLSFHKGRETLYEPSVVSIGPFYRGREELKAMEEHKWWFLRDFAYRNPKIPVEVYLEEMRTLEVKARQCYNESINLSSDDFVEMLLLDGCFILEYFLKYEEKTMDALCDVGWGAPTIMSDLLLLENQIPFFVIHKLAYIFSGPKNPLNCESICEILVEKLFPLLPYQEMLKPTELSCNEIHHLLHFYYLSLMPKSYNNIQEKPSLKRPLSWLWMQIPKQNKRRSSSVIIPCADELHDAGVKFKRNSSACMFHITFENGVMEMPLFVLDNTIQTIFTNLVAFEQSQIMKYRIFTSYVVLWNMLVDTGKDVSLLEHRGILELVQHNEEQAADFFNDLADCWTMDYNDHHYMRLFEKLQEFYGSAWNRSRARLMQDYFNNPWSSISVMAGFFLLILTVVQTYYTVYSGDNCTC